MYPPREGDLPRDELILAAERMMTDLHGEVEIHFKCTCQYCGERCTLEEPNKLYDSIICCQCGKETPIEFGGFMTMQRFNKPEQPKQKDAN